MFKLHWLEKKSKSNSGTYELLREKIVKRWREACDISWIRDEVKKINVRPINSIIKKLIRAE